MANRISRNVNEIKEMLREEGLYIIETDEEIERMLDVMVNYYSTDALLAWLCGGEYDPETARLILRTGLCSMPSTIAYADSPEMHAVAGWIPPGNKVLSIIPYLKNGGYELFRRNGFKVVSPLLGYQGYASKIRKSVTGKKDWYLFTFAVTPGFDCCAYSEKILRPMTRYGWEKGEACYCEVNSEEGIEIMKAAGFQVRNQGKVPGSKVNHYGVLV